MAKIGCLTPSYKLVMVIKYINRDCFANLRDFNVSNFSDSDLRTGVMSGDGVSNSCRIHCNGDNVDVATDVFDGVDNSL